MKKQLAVAVAMLFTTGMGMAHAADGTLNFTGTVTADTCTVAVNDQTNPTLNLGTVNTADLIAAGDTGPATNFTLNLTSCPETVTGASVTFSGNANGVMKTAFSNEAGTSDAAKNVGVQLYDASLKTVTPETALDVSSYLTENADKTMKSAAIPFTARMIAVANAATAGSLISHADYTISYQ
ncbi:fimbrial protein [Pseudescherichia sp.]|uniref:fimbrial protein n=1 Tax=Pseudescherichia sp. TaxID=2055881 RepID=UPI002896D3BE|nr:fimbrial protein [Pseudescherichia sp.]